MAVIQVGGMRVATGWRAAMHEHGPFRDSNHGPPSPDWDHLAISPVSYVLAIAGPVVLLASRRFPRSVIAITALITISYYSLGYPPGPVFLTPVIATVVWFKMIRAERVAQSRQIQQAESARTAGAERLRIAQELHDVLAHHISLINVQSGVALHLIDDKPEQSYTALSAIKHASKDALIALRGALETLRNVDDAAPRAPTDGLAQLDPLIESVRSAGIAVTVNINGTAVPLEPAVDLAALRIIQESLTNVLRHSGARDAWVTIDYQPDALDIVVTDNGRGGAAIPGNGLTGMRERASALGGHCDAGPLPGGGFKVTTRFEL